MSRPLRAETPEDDLDVCSLTAALRGTPFFDGHRPSSSPTSLSDPADVLPETTSIGDIEISSVNSQFRLSKADSFEAPFALVAANSVGKIIELSSQGTVMTLKYDGYCGKATIEKRGFVKIKGQKSYEENAMFARKLVREFVKIGRTAMGMYDFQFTMVILKAVLPFHINVMKMRYAPNSRVFFEPEIDTFATVKFRTQNATVRFATSGKLQVWCTGDNAARDPEMPNAKEAIYRFAEMASHFLLAGSHEAVVPNVSVADSPDKESEERFVCRRSTRIAESHDNFLISEDDEPIDSQPSTSASVEDSKKARFTELIRRLKTAFGDSLAISIVNEAIKLVENNPTTFPYPEVLQMIQEWKT